MVRGDETHEKLPAYDDLGPAGGASDNIATLGTQPTTEGTAPEGGDIDTRTAAGGAKKGAMTSGPSDPASIAGREGDFGGREGNEGSETAGTRA